MYKLFLLFFATGLFSQSIDFTQNKYLSAFDRFSIKKGTLTFKNDSIILKYEKDSDIIIFNKENIIIKTIKHEFVSSHEEEAKLFVFFSLVKAVFLDDFTEIKDNFTILKKDKVVLIPKEDLADVIQKIEYKKTNNKLEYLNIFFINKNRIHIVQNN